MTTVLLAWTVGNGLGLLSWSAGNSILLELTVAAIATVIGVFVGLLAGYRGGAVDRVLVPEGASA